MRSYVSECKGSLELGAFHTTKIPGGYRRPIFSLAILETPNEKSGRQTVCLSGSTGNAEPPI